MKLYAELPGRRVRQVLLDLAVLAWVLLWVRVAQASSGLVRALEAPGRSLQSAGGDLSRSLGEGAARARGVPLLGGPLASPLEAAGGAAERLAAAGAAGQQSVARLALVLALVVALAPTLPVLALWLLDRARWVRAASAAASARDGAAEVDLLALRALASRPLPELRRVAPSVGAAWRRGEPETLHRLAALELRGLGLRPPSAANGDGAPGS